MADAKTKPPPLQINAPVILLVGKTGAGKSTLGNLLLKTSEDETPTFHVSDSFSSVTKKSGSASYKIEDEIYNIIDTPGIFDTDDPTEDILKEIARTIQKCAYGIRAILFVFEAKRFTNEQKNTLDGITMFLGEESLQYMISVFSHCNKRQTKDPEYFKNSCWNDPVKDFVDSMNNRWAISPNADDFPPDNLVHKQRLKELKKHINYNINGVYTNNLFEKARKKQEENERKEREAEEERKKEYEKNLMSKGEALAKKYYEEQRKKDEEKFLKEKEKEITSIKNEFQGVIDTLKGGTGGYCQIV